MGLLGFGFGVGLWGGKQGLLGVLREVRNGLWMLIEVIMGIVVVGGGASLYEGMDT